MPTTKNGYHYYRNPAEGIPVGSQYHASWLYGPSPIGSGKSSSAGQVDSELARLKRESAYLDKYGEPKSSREWEAFNRVRSGGVVYLSGGGQSAESRSEATGSPGTRSFSTYEAVHLAAARGQEAYERANGIVETYCATVVFDAAGGFKVDLRQDLPIGTVFKLRTHDGNWLAGEHYNGKWLAFEITEDGAVPYHGPLPKMISFSTEEGTANLAYPPKPWRMLSSLKEEKELTLERILDRVHTTGWSSSGVYCPVEHVDGGYLVSGDKKVRIPDTVDKERLAAELRAWARLVEEQRQNPSMRDYRQPVPTFLVPGPPVKDEEVLQPGVIFQGSSSVYIVAVEHGTKTSKEYRGPVPERLLVRNEETGAYEWRDLTGAGIAARGIKDRAAGRESVEALLIAERQREFRPEGSEEPGIRLARLLNRLHGRDAGVWYETLKSRLDAWHNRRWSGYSGPGRSSVQG